MAAKRNSIRVTRRVRKSRKVKAKTDRMSEWLKGYKYGFADAEQEAEVKRYKGR